MGNARYPSSPGNPAAVAEILLVLKGLGSHEFWRDDVSLLDPTKVDTTRLLNSTQLTDTHLLALAKSHGGQLATLDRQFVADGVVDGLPALHRIR